MGPNPFTADLVTFTEEIRNGKLHFLYCDIYFEKSCRNFFVALRFSSEVFRIVLKEKKLCFMLKILIAEVKLLTSSRIHMIFIKGKFLLAKIMRKVWESY